MIDIDQYLQFTFFLVTLISFFSTLMFLGRVYWPKYAMVFGNLALLMGIPALTLVIAGVHAGISAGYWSMPLIYVVFCVFALVLDVILKIEFRQPRRLELLVPFLILYFIPQMGMWGMLWNLGIVRWVIAGVLYFSMVGSSIYASKKGVG